MALSASLGHTTPSNRCLHSTNSTDVTRFFFNGITNDDPNATVSFLSVTLEPADMETVVMDQIRQEEELDRILDALSSRIKIAEFIAETLMKRLTELQEIRNKCTFSQSSSAHTLAETDEARPILTADTGNSTGTGQSGDGGPDRNVGPEAALAQSTAVPNNTEAATATDTASIPSFSNSSSALTSSNSMAAATIPTPTPTPPPFLRRHTSIGAVPASGGKWEERATAFMLKRRSMQAAMHASQITDTRISPKLGLMGLGGNGFYSPPHARQFAKLPPNPRPGMHRMLSEKDVQEVSWEFERLKLNPRRGALVAAAWISYQDTWDDLFADIAEKNQNHDNGKDVNTKDTQKEHEEHASDDGDNDKDAKECGDGEDLHNSPPYLTFSKIPWPTLQTSIDPPLIDSSGITVEGVREFILSPFHSTDKSKETRLREANMRWHPDKSTQWLPLVVESDREAVQKGVEKVNWCLNNLK